MAVPGRERVAGAQVLGKRVVVAFWTKAFAVVDYPVQLCSTRSSDEEDS